MYGRRLTYPVLFFLALVPGIALADAIVADHTIVAEFELIPESVVDDVKNDFRMFYGHTSHGSQIVTGMEMIRDENPLFDFNNGPGTFSFQEYYGDLGHNGDTTWVAVTRNHLDQPGCETNVVMWSWCGGCSDNTEEGIDIYLNAMSRLEDDYPNVTFIYMTGHLDGTGPDGNLYARNNQIRDYCNAHGKVLFDFADIESYDPDGTWYPYGTDACEWCSTWCAAHPCPGCSYCAHSHCFNCYLKGKAFWWMLGAVAAGLDAGVVEADAPRLELSRNYPNPFRPTTEIRFSLPDAADVLLEVYDLSGRRVATLVDRRLAQGEHVAVWDGTDASGRSVASGTYFCRLRVGDSAQTRKMVLLR